MASINPKAQEHIRLGRLTDAVHLLADDAATEASLECLPMYSDGLKHPLQLRRSDVAHALKYVAELLKRQADALVAIDGMKVGPEGKHPAAMY